tara:strand:+ start:377 stop:529 length:153 start_codon:yes stop_codon:yes gene_type:complete
MLFSDQTMKAGLAKQHQCSLLKFGVHRFSLKDNLRLLVSKKQAGFPEKTP